MNSEIAGGWVEGENRFGQRARLLLPGETGTSTIVAFLATAQERTLVRRTVAGDEALHDGRGEIWVAVPSPIPRHLCLAPPGKESHLRLVPRELLRGVEADIRAQLATALDGAAHMPRLVRIWDRRHLAARPGTVGYVVGRSIYAGLVSVEIFDRAGAARYPPSPGQPESSLRRDVPLTHLEPPTLTLPTSEEDEGMAYLKRRMPVRIAEWVPEWGNREGTIVAVGARVTVQLRGGDGQRMFARGEVFPLPPRLPTLIVTYPDGEVVRSALDLAQRGSVEAALAAAGVSWRIEGAA